jgi:hypothetical protein
LNYVLLEPDQWNHVVWEIPHLARDKVTGVSLVYRLQGNEPGATNRVCFDFDRLELQRVKADYFEGWGVAPNRIAFSHTGYILGGPMSALASGWRAAHFELVRNDTGKTVLRKPILTVKGVGSGMRATPLGPVYSSSYQVLDFSEVTQAGEHVIRVGDLVTRPFWIHEDVWRDTIWKTVNFFYAERCGMEIPSIHEVCHRDWQAAHGAQQIPINGGWHDAGDLSQGLVNTAEATYAMLSLAQKAGAISDSQTPGQSPADAALSQRLLEEAKWGLAWMLKTRFGDGFRVSWATMDFWTDGVLGNADDVLGETRNAPFDNFLGAAAEALAYRVFKERDPALATQCLQAAQEDWRFAVEKSTAPNLELAAAGALASLELYQATSQQKYADRAFELAEVILQCQQREFTDWSLPLAGFFYTSPKRERRLHYSHRGHEQGPAVALAGLCAAFPDHNAWMEWYSAVLLHSEYLKTAAQFTAPYGMLPSSVYSLAESSNDWFQQQVTRGVLLGDQCYLRLFPVWTSFRGNHGTVLSQTKALSVAAHLRRNLALADLCQLQLQWIVGRNPFAQSTMYGEGYDYAPQYTAMSGDMVGSLPVGIQTRANEDQPYWPAANCYNYKEVWVHPSSRWLWLMCDLTGPAQVKGLVLPKVRKPVEFMDARSGKIAAIKPDYRTGRFAAKMPSGHYTVRHGPRQKTISLLPGATCELDLRQAFDFDAIQQTTREGQVTIQVRVTGSGLHRFTIRSHNLTLDKSEQTVELRPGPPQTLQWIAPMKSLNEHWIAVVVPDGDLSQRKELLGTQLRQSVSK